MLRLDARCDVEARIISVERETTLLANSIYLTAKPEQLKGKDHIISATGICADS